MSWSRRNVLLCAAAGLIANVTWAKPMDWPKPNAQQASINDRLAIDTPIGLGSLTLFPVVDRYADPDAESMAGLREAMVRGLVKIDEQPQGGEVGTLLVSNVSSEPVMAITGDVVYGGNQDRMIARDVVIPPRTGPIPISVHCVEQQRWQLNGEFQYGGRAEWALSQLVALGGSQQETWTRVDRLNAEKAQWAGKPSADPSATYMHAMRAMPSNHGTAVALMRELSARKNVVGLVVAQGGRIVASEIYPSPAQFIRLRSEAVSASALAAMKPQLERVSAPDSATAAAFVRRSLAGRQGEVHATRTMDDDGNIHRMALYSAGSMR